MNNITIIGVDHGNAQIKTTHTVFQTSPLNRSTVDPGHGGVLEYRGEYYSLKDKRLPVETDKSKSETFFLLTLMAVGRELIARDPDPSVYRNDIALVVGIPPSTFNANSRKVWEEYFKERMGGIIEFNYLGKKFTLHLMDCRCYAQGLVVVMDSMTDIARTGLNALLVDIGGYTTDIVRVDLDAPKEDRMKFNSIDDLGMNRFYYEMVEKLNNTFNHKVTPQMIEKALDPEKVTSFTAKEVDYIMNHAEEQAVEIIGAVKEQLGADIRDYNVFFCGGGSTALEPQISMILKTKDNATNLKIIRDICANAKGYENAYIRDQKRKSKKA